MGLGSFRKLVISTSCPYLFHLGELQGDATVKSSSLTKLLIFLPSMYCHILHEEIGKYLQMFDLERLTGCEKETLEKEFLYFRLWCFERFIIDKSLLGEIDVDPDYIPAILNMVFISELKKREKSEEKVNKIVDQLRERTERYCNVYSSAKQKEARELEKLIECLEAMKPSPERTQFLETTIEVLKSGNERMINIWLKAMEGAKTEKNIEILINKLKELNLGDLSSSTAAKFMKICDEYTSKDDEINIVLEFARNVFRGKYSLFYAGEEEEEVISAPPLTSEDEKLFIGVVKLARTHFSVSLETFQKDFEQSVYEVI